MVSNRKKSRSRKIKPGDGHALQRYRWWQPLSRSLFHLRLLGEDGQQHIWSVDVHHGGDSDGEVLANLYLDGQHQARSKFPAAFPVPGGTIEVVNSSYGLRRCHFVSADGAERQLAPDPLSGEGRRARLQASHPRLSQAIGLASLAVLLVALVLGVPQLVELVSSIPLVAENLGTFVSPIHLPTWANITLVIATILASSERALRLRYNWLLDGGLFDGDE